jgi:hypothetical protein
LNIPPRLNKIVTTGNNESKDFFLKVTNVTGQTSAPSKRCQLTKLNLPKLAGRKASLYLRTQLVQIYQFKIFQFTYNHSESTSTKIEF